jgi:hypothetical protein
VTAIPANCWISAAASAPHEPATGPAEPDGEVVGPEGDAAGTLGASVGDITAEAVAGTELGDIVVGPVEPAEEPPQAVTVTTIPSTVIARNIASGFRRIGFASDRVPGARRELAMARDSHT